MWISSQVFSKDFVDRFGTTYIKNGFLWGYVSRILLIDFTISSYLDYNSFKSTLKKVLKCFSSIISCFISSGIFQELCWSISELQPI